jgi:hypothetical protein
MLAPAPNDTSIPAALPRAVEGEETLASEDTPPTEGAGAALAPKVTKPSSTGGRSGAGRRP